MAEVTKVRAEIRPGMIGVVFCGGCNPQIDRKQMLYPLYQVLPEDYCLVGNKETSKWELGIMLCGCASACVDRPAIRSRARHWIVVAGSQIECKAVTENRIPEVLALTVLAWLDQPQVKSEFAKFE